MKNNPDEFLLKKFSERLKIKLMTENISLVDFAKKTELEVKTLETVLNEEDVPIFVLIRLSNYLDVKLLGGCRARLC